MNQVKGRMEFLTPRRVLFVASWLLLAPAVFVGCKSGNLPAAASNPATNAALPVPPESSLTTNIAFTGIATNGDNAFTFVVLQALSSSTTLYFTDSSWDANAGNFSGSNFMSFVPSKILAPGTQVLYSEPLTGSSTPASLVYNSGITGTCGIFNNTFGMKKFDTEIIAFMVPSAGATQFLTAVNANTSSPWLTSGPVSKGFSYLPPGLSYLNTIDLYSKQGESVVFSDCADVQYPNEITSTSLLAHLVYPANWTVGPSGGSTALPGTGVNMCDFTAILQPVATAVPILYNGPPPTLTPTPCGYPGPTCTPVPANLPTAGSIAFTGLTFNGNSQISFVNTTALPSGQVLYFTNYSYDATVPGLVDESFNNGSTATTVVEGIISYTAPAGELAAYHQVVIGNTSDETNQLEGGAVANVVGASGDAWLVQNHNGYGQKVLAYCVSGGVTTWLGAALFGPDSWTTSGAIPAGNCWDSYLPPGLDSTTSTDLSGLWATDNLNQYASSTQNDNAILNSCQSTLAGIVNPANWVADGNQSKTAVNLSPVGPRPTGACTTGSGGYTGGLP
jgi:hypothetical protein